MMCSAGLEDQFSQYQTIDQQKQLAKNDHVMLPFAWFSPIVTWFFIGKFPIAPGTFGSLAAYPIYYLVHLYCGDDQVAIAHYLLMCTLAIFLLACPAVYAFEKATGSHDNKVIVVDEVIGQLLTLGISYLWLYKLAWPTIGRQPMLLRDLIFLIGFVAFRYFDITKILLIGLVDKLHWPIATILDDLLAALAASGVFYLIYLFGLYGNWI